MKRTSTIFDLVFSKPRSFWLKLSASSLLLLLPFWVASIDGVFYDMLYQGRWRVFLLAPVIIVYIWFIPPVMAKVGAQAVRDIRPLILVDEDHFQSMIKQSTRIQPLHEIAAFGVGVLLGILSAQATGFEENAPGLKNLLVYLQRHHVWGIGLDYFRFGVSYTPEYGDIPPAAEG